MGDITDQVGTVDTTGLAGHADIETVMVAPELLEAAAEAGEEGLSEEEREALPTSLAEQKAEEEAAEGEEGAETPGDGDVGGDVAEEEPEPEPEPEPVETSYDPGAHSVAEVISHIQNNPDERAAIVEAERAGKARKGILDL